MYVRNDIDLVCVMMAQGHQEKEKLFFFIYIKK